MTDVQIPIFPSNDYSPVSYDADGSTVDFAIPWPYLGRINFDGSRSPYINVYLFNEALGYVLPLAPTAWTMPSATSIRLNEAPAIGYQVWIYRDSGTNGRAVDYASGATVDEETLDLDSLQTWYMLQEVNANTRISHNTLEGQTQNVFPLPEFEFKGSDGPAFTLQQGETIVDISVAESSVWFFKNGTMAQTDDISVANNIDGVVVVTYLGELDPADDILIRIARQTNIAVDLSNGSIGTDELQDGAVTFEKLDLDGVGGDLQIAGWTTSAGLFGAYTLTHNWVVDFDTGVRENRLDQMTAPTNNVSMGGQKIINLANGTAATDAATVGQVSAASGFFPVSVQSISEPNTNGATPNDTWIKPSATVATMVVCNMDRNIQVYMRAGDSAPQVQLARGEGGNESGDTVTFILAPNWEWKYIKVNGTPRHVTYIFAAAS